MPKILIVDDDETVRGMLRIESEIARYGRERQAV
jgi:hypothetical protein